MKYRIISDPHYHHQLLVEIGDRKTGYEKKIHNSLMAIPEEDTLIYLGDICIGMDTTIHERYIKPLKCKKVLVKGNHDGKSNSRYMDNGWDFVCDSLTLKQFGKEILLIHIPTQETKEWAEKKDDRLVIHGHRHTFKRFDRGIHPFDKHKLYSCEIEKMQPRTLEYMIHKK